MSYLTDRGAFLYADENGNLTHSERLIDGTPWVNTRDGFFKNSDGTFRSHGRIHEVEYFFGYGFEHKKPHDVLSNEDLKVFSGLDKDGKNTFLKTARARYIKGIKSGNGEVIGNLIDRTKTRFEAYLKEKKFSLDKIDHIVVLPSSSNLNHMIARTISEWCLSASILHNTLKKANGSEVTASVDETTPGFVKAHALLKTVLEKLKLDNKPFKISGAGGIPSTLRRYFSKFIVASDVSSLARIKGKNILLIDDTIHEGNSLSDAHRELMLHAPKSIHSYVFFHELRSGTK